LSELPQVFVLSPVPINSSRLRVVGVETITGHSLV